jgi:hypothetical protein
VVVAAGALMIAELLFIFLKIIILVPVVLVVEVDIEPPSSVTSLYG